MLVYGLLRTDDPSMPQLLYIRTDTPKTTPLRSIAFITSESLSLGRLRIDGEAHTGSTAGTILSLGTFVRAGAAANRLLGH